MDTTDNNMVCVNHSEINAIHANIMETDCVGIGNGIPEDTREDHKIRVTRCVGFQ